MSFMTLFSQIATNSISLTTMPVRRPGAILGPIATLLGIISNFCFNIVYAITPVASLGITIIFFTIIVKALLFPLSIKQQRSMIKTQLLQPKLKAIQDKYKDAKDPELQQKMNLELSAVYRENKINPFSGCLPLLFQMPILFALYYVVQQPEFYITQISDVLNNISQFIELNLNPIKEALISVYTNLGDGNMPMEQIQYVMRVLETQEMYGIDVATVNGITQGINAMSVADMQTFINTFFTGFTQFSQSQIPILVELNNLFAVKNEIYNFLFLNLVEAPGLGFPGIAVPVITWFTTYLTYKTSMSLQNQAGPGNDMVQKQQKIMMMIFPFMMAFMTINLPSGMGLYWNVTNLIQIIQQWALNKFFTPKEIVKEEAVIEAKEVNSKKGSNSKKRGV